MSTISAAAATRPAATATRTIWAVDAAHSNIEFSVRHLMITSVKGRFADVRGTVAFNEHDFADVEVDVTVGAASVDTRMPQRDDHLRSSDFFDVEQFPTLTFKSRRAVARAAGELTLVGDLTIRGVTREVEFDVTSQGTQADPWGGRRAGFEATAKIKRSDFGLTWNQALEMGGVAVGDEVKISIDLQLVQQV
jgi:polyisoprenoid-binding protein YceI